VTQWQPVWRVKIDGTDYTSAILSNLWKTAGHEFWDNRTINYTDMLMFDKKAADIMMDALVRSKEAIKQSYDLEEIYPDLLQVIALTLALNLNLFFF
jgi:hypothetical protein